MPAITPLVCSACGSQLRPTADHDRFTCPNCGTEHLVDRTASPTPMAASSVPVALSSPALAPASKGKRNTSGVLLELLDRIPDTGTLDILLEPVNLLKLMLLHGWTDDEIKQQLAGGKIPGELLLELLQREPDPNKLLAELGKPAMPAQKQAVPATIRHPATTSASEFSPRVAGAIFVIFGLVFAVGVIVSFFAFPGNITKLQIGLLCSAPILVLMGVFQMITNRKILN